MRELPFRRLEAEDRHYGLFPPLEVSVFAERVCSRAKDMVEDAQETGAKAAEEAQAGAEAAAAEAKAAAEEAAEVEGVTGAHAPCQQPSMRVTVPLASLQKPRRQEST